MREDLEPITIDKNLNKKKLFLSSSYGYKDEKALKLVEKRSKSSKSNNSNKEIIEE